MSSRYKKLKVDEKWSIVYDVENNCRPIAVHRYGELSPNGSAMWNNLQTAMFYRLLEIEEGFLSDEQKD